jgi:hypothetical protein
MRSLFEKKHWVLLISILALGALAVLSFSLKNVSFDEAQPIGREDARAVSPNLPDDLTKSYGEVSLLSKIIVWSLLATLAVLIVVMLSPEARKKMLRMLVRLAFSILALYYLFLHYPEIFRVFNFGLNFNQAPEQTDAVADIPPPVFTPPQETPLLSYLVGLLVVFGVMFFLWKSYRTWREINRSEKIGSLQAIAQIARSSLRDLSDGRESTDVILNCYFRMSDVVADRKNLRRNMGMTASEFAIRLERSGLPGDAVRRLTHLFEAVRYGERKAGPRDVNEAVACLTTILHYCGETA